MGYLQVKWFEGPEKLDDFPHDLLARLASDAPVLITAALRDHIVARVPLITEALLRRPAASETVFLACENAPHAAYAQISKVVGEVGALELGTVVNRMCISLEDDSRGRRMVSAHPLGEWLIQGPSRPNKVLQALSGAPEVELVDDIHARHDRKLWMVNGAHQVLAIMARRAGFRSLRTAAGSPKVQSRLSHIHAAMNEALHQTHPHLGGSLDYAVAHVVAYCEHPDSIKRVLGSFRRLDLAPFVRTLEDRLARPARICREHDFSTDAFTLAVDVLEQLMANPTAYVDAKRLRPPHRDLIDPAKDQETLDAYRSFLTGWMATDEVERRTECVNGLLAAQRFSIPA